MIRDQLTNKPGGANNPYGCKGKEEGINHNNVMNDSNKATQGNSLDYTLARLTKEAPELREMEKNRGGGDRKSDGCSRQTLILLGIHLKCKYVGISGETGETEAITTVRICAISLLAVILVCSFGPDLNAGQTVYRLEPPDRSSPRATLQTFLDNMNKAVVAYKSYNEETL